MKLLCMLEKPIEMDAEVNPDGMPLCPVCDAEEMWGLITLDSTVNILDSVVNLQQYLRAGLSCYRCASMFEWFEDR